MVFLQTWDEKCYGLKCLIALDHIFLPKVVWWGGLASTFLRIKIIVLKFMIINL
jgi:hypothetical protein